MNKMFALSDYRYILKAVSMQSVTLIERVELRGAVLQRHSPRFSHEQDSLEHH